ncbi:hypothetical protein [Phytohabitans suffuscus]|uniref:Uncharacterized protein n=1 Tax=Phytohabitans suffuscus TaxID=624315 RepID=A0A6F8YWJ7_9ACTN|nr:hypothetical protein [Phytohabitans suffuscus]BCB90517.1 hypothetical protein Psuf_078300 [Phytohabitans suffuscus]
MIFGLPATVIGLVAAALVLAAANRYSRSGLVTGTVSALAGLLVGPLVAFCVLTVLF